MTASRTVTPTHVTPRARPADRNALGLRRDRWLDPRPWAVSVGVATAAVWLRGGGGELLRSDSVGLWLAAGQVAGLVAGLGALAGIVLVARPVRLERRHGLDQMLRWHRVVGITTVAALLVHMVASATGFADGDPGAAPDAVLHLMASAPWAVAAVVAAVLMLVVGMSSWRRLKQRLPYETWYLLHLNGYLAVALGFGHQVTMGRTFVADPVARTFWWGLSAATAAVVVWSRLGGLLRSVVRRPLRVVAVRPVGRGTVAVTVAGPGAEGLGAVAGQFVSVRFLTAQLWWQSHPFSLSAAPVGNSIRLTIKNLGDATARIPRLRLGTRVLLQGPYGRMRLDAAPGRRLVLIGAGVGVAPMVALLESCGAWRRPAVLVRGHDLADIPHLGELRRLVEERCGRLFVITGPRQQWRAGNPFTAANLHARIPDIDQRAAFVCGPPALQSAAESGLRAAGVPATHVHSERFGW